MSHHEIPLEFYNEAQHLGPRIEGELRSEVEHRLPRLEECYASLHRVVAALEQPIQREFTDLYQAKVVVYDDLGKVTTTTKELSPMAAMKEALTVMEKLAEHRYS